MTFRSVLVVGVLAVATPACDRAETSSTGTPTHRSASSAPTPEATARLAFVVDGDTKTTLTKRELMDRVGAVEARGFDPYYERDKAFECLPLEAVLATGFGGRTDLVERHFVLRAADGYTVPIEGHRLFEPGGCLAVVDLEHPAWEPIGRQRAHPGPFYLIWREPSQRDIERHPRPWALVAIEITSFERQFPLTVPDGLPADDPALHGFALFRDQCLRCHAINQQGGQIGPELNVPQNLLAYRPEEQVRAYIRNPETFRYSKMPAFANLSDQDLDALIAYLRAMGERKRPPARAAAPPAPPASAGPP